MGSFLVRGEVMTSNDLRLAADLIIVVLTFFCWLSAAVFGFTGSLRYDDEILHAVDPSPLQERSIRRSASSRNQNHRIPDRDTAADREKSLTLGEMSDESARKAAATADRHVSRPTNANISRNTN